MNSGSALCWETGSMSCIDVYKRQVLNNRSVELAKKYNVELEVLSGLNPVPGMVVKEVTKDMEGMLIKGVAKDTDVAVITIQMCIRDSL